MDLLKGMLGGGGGGSSVGSSGGGATAGGAKSDRAKKLAGKEPEPTEGRRRRRDRDYDRITSVTIPRYRMSPSHVEYTIEVRKAGVAWQVSRRYQQFKKLHADLTALCPMTTPYHCEYGVVPVLCGSSWTEVTNHSTELVERRRRFLEIYLEQLIVPKNRFYQQRTALYSFFHDDECVLSSQPGTTPLPGLGAGGGTIDAPDWPPDAAGWPRLTVSSAAQGEPPAATPPTLRSVLPPTPAGSVTAPIVANSSRVGPSPMDSGLPSSVPAPSFRTLIADTAQDGAVSSPRADSGAGTPQHNATDVAAGDIFERCEECGRMEVVDYPVASWENFGPCDTCLRYTRWMLTQEAGDSDPIPISCETAVALQAAAAAAGAPPAAAPAAAQHPQQPDTSDGGSPIPPPPAAQPIPAAGCSPDGHLSGAASSGAVASSADARSGGAPVTPVNADRKKAAASDDRSRKHTSVSEVRPEWKQDSDVSACELCGDAFHFFLRKHHCRRCGGIFCGTCAGFSAALPEHGYLKEVRVCRPCKQGKQQSAPNSSPREDKSGPTSGPRGTHRRPELSAIPTGDSVAASSDSGGKDNIPLGVAVAESAEDGDQIPLAHSEIPRSVVEHGTLAGLSLQRELQPTDFELITTLGKGTFGKVMKVAHRDTGNIYAMKVLSKRVVHKRRMIKYIREEKEILSRLQHPFIVSLHASFQTEHHLYLVLEFLPGGELYTHIYAQGRFGEADARFYTAEIALALEYLHMHDIVHRDIKPENIVLDRHGHARLTDFGLAKSNFSAETRRSFVGSAEYLAPETVKGEPQSTATDWWSVGVLLFEMLVGMAPFNGPNNNDVYQQILHKELDFSAARIRSADAVGLLSQLLRKDPARRLREPALIKKDPFWNTIDWDAVLAREVRPPFVPDLAHNDTRYFSREFTFEWARIESEKVGRATLDLVATKFDNFPVAGSAVSGMPSQGMGNSQRVVGSAVTGLRSEGGGTARSFQPQTSPRALAGRHDGLNHMAATIVDDAASTTPVHSHVAGLLGQQAWKTQEQAQLEHQQLLRDICGEWLLRSLEVTAEDGKVSYPWGPDAVGQAMYTTHGLFSMQLATPKELRPRFRDPDYKRVTRDEMAEAYIGYVAFFGTFSHAPGRPYISTQIQGSLCPNWVNTTQKRFFRFCNSQGVPDRDHLVLTTSPMGVDGEAARTVMRFERVKSGDVQLGPVPAQLQASTSSQMIGKSTSGQVAAAEGTLDT